MIGPFDSDTPERCFSVVVVTDSVCEGEVDGEGVPRGEVFSAVVRSQEGSDVEVTGSSRVASITIEDSPECSMCVYCSSILRFMYYVVCTSVVAYIHSHTLILYVFVSGSW